MITVTKSSSKETFIPKWACCDITWARWLGLSRNLISFFSFDWRKIRRKKSNRATSTEASFVNSQSLHKNFDWPKKSDLRVYKKSRSLRSVVKVVSCLNVLGPQRLYDDVTFQNEKNMKSLLHQILVRWHFSWTYKGF